MKAANNAPIYACLYTGLAEIARTHGYALAVHGTLARDFDLIAVPWTEEAGDPDAVIRAIVDKYALRCLEHEKGEAPALMPHGRIVYTVVFKWGDVFLDIGFMPPVNLNLNNSRLVKSL